MTMRGICGVLLFVVCSQCVRAYRHQRHKSFSQDQFGLTYRKQSRHEQFPEYSYLPLRGQENLLILPSGREGRGSKDIVFYPSGKELEGEEGLVNQPRVGQRNEQRLAKLRREERHFSEMEEDDSVVVEPRVEEVRKEEDMFKMPRVGEWKMDKDSERLPTVAGLRREDPKVMEFDFVEEPRVMEIQQEIEPRVLESQKKLEMNKEPKVLESQKMTRAVPSEDDCAIRNEFEVKSGGMTCQKKCNIDDDCKNEHKYCLCDGACGKSCLRPDKECSELPDPPHGQVHLTGRDYQAKAVYTCDEGYQIVGMEKVICQASGRWSGSQPTCKQYSGSPHSPYYCSSPPNIANARHNGTTEQTFYDLDTELSYQCFPGFRREGFDHAKCFFMNGTAMWYGPDLICHPIECGPPEDILNGKRHGDCTTYRCEIVYECLAGFELVGKAMRYCQADATWTQSELPTCVPVQCEIPTSPTNGKALFTAVAYKSVVSYECKYGYMIVGDNTRTCGKDKTWSGTKPECKEINCGSPGGGNLPNGWLEGSRTTLHAVVTFRCQEGTHFEGESYRTTCNADGKWSHPLPKCLASCIIPQIANGKVFNKSVGETVPHGHNILINCTGHKDTRKVYEIASNSTPIQCNNGTWTQLPRCEPARCKTMPTPPRNGMIVVPKTKHGSIGLYQCKDGYQLMGDNKTRCEYGNWTGATPSCDEIYCPFPGYLIDGRVLLVGNMGLYDYRPYVRRIKNDRQIMFDCNKGYKLEQGSPRGATCVAGRWSPDIIPTCHTEFHPSIRWLDKRSIKAAELRQVFPGIRVKRSIERKRKRRSDKSNKRDCPELDSKLIQKEILKVGKAKDGAHNSRGTVLKVSCIRGYGITLPKRKVKCKKGVWKPETPECVAKSCKVPTNVEATFKHKEVQVPPRSEIPHGEELVFACTDGYFREGAEKFRCNFGEWVVPQMSKCIGNPCVLPSVDNGEYLGINYRAGQTIPHNTLIDFECNHGYIKSLVNPLQCKKGELIPMNPLCQADGGQARAEAFHSSNPELDAYDPSTEMPPLDNPVSPEFPVRKTEMGKSCLKPEKINGTVDFSVEGEATASDVTYPDGSVVKFDCNEMKEGSGRFTSWQIRCDDGKWLGQALQCDENGNLIEDLEKEGFEKPCSFTDPGDNLVTFHNKRQIMGTVTLEPGAELISRCSDIGKFKLVGSYKRRCVGGRWDGREPTCQGLSQMHDFDLEHPPTILFRHEGGNIGQSNAGELVVIPGTILHMECLYLKRYGQPTWSVVRSTRKGYPQGWATGHTRDSALEYRLSIYHAASGDTGEYTCETPQGHSHTIKIIVDDVSCPVIPPNKGLEKSSDDHALGAKVTFSCNNGNSLIGAEMLTCQSSGLWTDMVPACEEIVCPNITTLITDPHLRVNTLSHESGGRVVFSCPHGHDLLGAESAHCQADSTWSVEQLPACKPIECEAPEVPENGELQRSAGPFHAGDIAKFHCQVGFMMKGQPVASCQEDGTWSRESPECVKACTYPGTTIGGTINQVKFYYTIGETVKFTCAQGLRLQGAKILKCLKSGRWSSSIPTCRA